MLVGDYCPRALDPVFLLKDAFLDELDAVLQNEEPAVEDESKEEKFGQAEQTDSDQSEEETPEP